MKLQGFDLRVSKNKADEDLIFIGFI